MEEFKRFQTKNKKYTELMASPVNNSEFSITGTLTGFSHFIGIKPVVTKLTIVLFTLMTSGVVGILLYLLFYYLIPKYDAKNDLSFNDNVVHTKQPDIIIKSNNRVEKVINPKK